MAPSTTAELDTWRETRMVPVGQLTRYPGNARRGDVASLRKSIRRHGQYRALIVQDKGDGALTVVAGNHTFDAMLEEGYREVRVELHDMDDDLALRVNVADNRQAELGTNDQDALLALLGQMDGDFEGIGYDQDDIDAMLTHDVIPADPEPAAPAAAAPRRPAAEQGGDEPDPAEGDGDEDEDGAEPARNKGLGNPVISYNIVFDNEVQQAAWYDFLRQLRGHYQDLETIGERLHAYLGSHQL